MASCWVVLLLLVTVAAAVPVKTPQPYEKAIARAIDFYNQGPTVKYAFRLLTATAPPQVVSTEGFPSLAALNFTIMETTCPASDKTPVEQCAFKENGLNINTIRSQVGLHGDANTLLSPSIQPVRVTRIWWPALSIGAKIVGHGIDYFRRRG
uniref:Cystatin domain-containing protein n=1 Tax=Chelonoidis abingdonii TaxID=106734 RepID=A0A8C0H1U0_CHEAB